ncbi:pentapeptide repeat-containing protein [Micromonospora sp. Llam0]|uniref:pentapeptide repeat-containing protein n=1 Tax=Micromonospora sp. Llam0 TaxID=2485143 RepID=UPI000F4A8E85|nr:hypothetical protein [Micromonospora sp. Llam0]
MGDQTVDELVVDRQELTGVDFSGRRLQRIGVIGSRLRSCLFQKVRTENATLGSGPETSEYIDCVFDGARISHASGRARFVRCSFRDVILKDWNSTAFELVDCTFSGRLRNSVFYGHPDAVYVPSGEPPRNEFHGNDFSAADLVRVEFRWGVDLSRQRLPDGPDYVYLPDLPVALARARGEVEGWPEGDRRRRARILLGVFDREVDLGQTQCLIRLSESVRRDGDVEFFDLLKGTPTQ